MSTPVLPTGFEDLAPWVSWCLPTETERNRRRNSVTMEEIRAFSQAMLVRAPQIVSYLNRHPLSELPSADLPLLQLLLSLAEVAPAIEFYGQPSVVDGYDPARFAAQEGFVLRPRF